MRRVLLPGIASLVLTVVVLAAGPAFAQAANSITVSVSADGVAGLPITVTGMVNIDPAYAGNNLWAVYVLPGGGGSSCPPTDPSATVVVGAGDLPAGPDTRQHQLVLTAAGSYLACGYVDDSTAGNVLATASMPFQVRGPHESLRISGRRHMRAPGLIPRVTHIHISYSSESPRNLYVTAGFGRACGRNVINTFSRVFNRAGGTIGPTISFQVSGNGRKTYGIEQPLRGTYVVCAFLGTSAKEVDAKSRWVFHVK